NPGSVVRNMCKQETEGLRFLHDNGICYGGSYFSGSSIRIYLILCIPRRLTKGDEDFRPANILIRLVSLDRLSETEIFELFGEPYTSDVKMAFGEEVPNPASRYLVD